jgi:hypothetical protein
MTIHIAVLGIDGSGKSTIASSLPVILAAEIEAQTAGAGEELRVIAPDEDHLAPKFHPDGYPLSVRIARILRKFAKLTSGNRIIYPIFKLPQMIFQDRAAKSLGRRYRTEAVVCDGNLLLTASGRTANYRRPASSQGNTDRAAPGIDDLTCMFAYLVDGKPLPAETRAKLPPLRPGRLLSWLSQLTGFNGVWLPDAVIFLDINPELAVQRVRSRGQKIDRHENPADMAQARKMYLEAVEAFRRYRGGECVHVLEIQKLSPGAVCRLAVEKLRPALLACRSANAALQRPLGTTKEKLTGKSFWAKVFNYKYLVRYMLRHFFNSAWREPAFVFSDMGRLFLKEGYSAGVMRVIYDRDAKKYGLFDRIFLGYPLHRAVYDRLQILTRRIEPVLEERLKAGEVRIFTAPSGFAYDLFRPLEAITARSPELMRNVKLVACDLDPHEALGPELRARAAKLSIHFQFLRGDIMNPELRAQIAAGGPYHVALFVGLSSWLPKPLTVKHLSWLRGHLRDDAVLVTDCFTPEAYALSGRYVGYKAQYYTPEIYKVLLDYCGYDGLHAEVESGRDRINHVVIANVSQGVA